MNAQTYSPPATPSNDTRGMLLGLTGASWDDGLAAPLPKTKPLTVAWFAVKPDPFTELALSSLIEAGRIDMKKGDPAA